MTALQTKPGFDWNKLTWSRPDSPAPVICSYCSGALPNVPLTLWSADSHAVSFCDDCAEKWFGLKTFKELQDDE